MGNDVEKDLERLNIVVNRRKEELEIELAKLNSKLDEVTSQGLELEQQIKIKEYDLKQCDADFKKSIMSSSFDAKLLHKGRQKIKRIMNKIASLTKNLEDLEEKKKNIENDIIDTQKGIRTQMVQLKKYDEISRLL